MTSDQTLTPGALTGVRVIDLSDTNGVYATKMLVDLGADVIRVEPVSGDPMRKLEPMVQATGESAFYAFMNAGKRAVALDLDSAQGQAMFADLVATAEIVVESARPGTLDAKGIGYRALSADHSALIWTTVTPFGSDGPHAHWQADDLVSQAMGGLLTLSGLP
jgi:benzylsuccinate CoA-transferase BbsE subunit